MVYINGKVATKEDEKMLKKWIKEGKTKATGKVNKEGNLVIVTKD